MTKRGRAVKPWYVSLLLLAGLGLIFVSCNSDDGGNPISPQGETQSDFVASQGQSDEWGAYYVEGDSSFYVNIPEAGDFQLEYAIINEAGYKGGPFYITFDTPESAILEVGLKSGHTLDYACVTSGTIAVTEETANVGIKTSWKVTVYSITDESGENVPWWTPSSDVQGIFTADPGSEKICAIQEGQRGDGIVEITPPGKGGGGSTGGGTTPPPTTLTIAITGTNSSGAAATLSVSGCTTGNATTAGATVTATNPSTPCALTITTTGAFPTITVNSGSGTDSCTNVRDNLAGVAFGTIATNGTVTLTCNATVQCGGTVVDGTDACWYLGATDWACSGSATASGNVCDTHGGYDSASTIAIGSGAADNTPCINVLNAIKSPITALSGSDAGTTLGCGYHTTYPTAAGSGYRWTAGTTGDAYNSVVERACGCQQ